MVLGLSCSLLLAFIWRDKLCSINRKYSKLMVPGQIKDKFVFRSHLCLGMHQTRCMLDSNKRGKASLHSRRKPLACDFRV